MEQDEIQKMCCCRSAGTVPDGSRSSERPGRAERGTGGGLSAFCQWGEHLCQQDGEYADAETIGTWPVKLGRRSETGDKVQEGDEITPSGSFYVCTRNDQSICYLALGLSYPNAEDAERGLRDGLINEEQYHAILEANKAGVQPPWNTPLGGAIEIHGDQGGGTSGCIAVTNDVMDILWEYCPLGVPVTVGP